VTGLRFDFAAALRRSRSLRFASIDGQARAHSHQSNGEQKKREKMVRQT